MGALSRRLAARALLASDALVRRVRPARLRVAARALHSGAWLGLASDALLVAVDEETYARGRYAYHDTDAHNLRGLFDWEVDAIETYFPAGGRILLTSAGGGREVVALRQRGFDVAAFECNEQLRARANDLLGRLGQQADVGPVPRDRCPDARGPFAGAIIGWGAYTFLRGTALRRAFLADVASRLTPGAPVLLSFFTRPGDARRFRAIARIGRALGGSVEVGDVLDPTWQHYVTRSELEVELASAGLQLTRWSTAGYGHAVAHAAARQ